MQQRLEGTLSFSIKSIEVTLDVTHDWWPPILLKGKLSIFWTSNQQQSNAFNVAIGSHYNCCTSTLISITQLLPIKPTKAHNKFWLVLIKSHTSQKCSPKTA